MGKALINGEFYEVSTNGDFIDQQTDMLLKKLNIVKL